MQCTEGGTKGSTAVAVSDEDLWWTFSGVCYAVYIVWRVFPKRKKKDQSRNRVQDLDKSEITEIRYQRSLVQVAVGAKRRGHCEREESCKE
jgi:hypothetical protein